MNGFDIGLGFLKGLALIASPCILPVLPLVPGSRSGVLELRSQGPGLEAYAFTFGS